MVLGYLILTRLFSSSFLLFCSSHFLLVLSLHLLPTAHLYITFYPHSRLPLLAVTTHSTREDPHSRLYDLSLLTKRTLITDTRTHPSLHTRSDNTSYSRRKLTPDLHSQDIPCTSQPLGYTPTPLSPSTSLPAFTVFTLHFLILTSYPLAFSGTHFGARIPPPLSLPHTSTPPPSKLNVP